jgi:precorrin-6Y C5,15-methyltransferase (decarboxylating)
MVRVKPLGNVERAEITCRRFGLPDHAFEQRRPLRGQITKSEARAVSLHALGLRIGSIIWDIGAGTGSVAIEAARIAIQGHIYAVDRDDANSHLLEQNVEKYGDGRVSVVIGEAPGVLANLPDPDAAFIGGGGSSLPEILGAVVPRLRPSGRVVANFAAIERANFAYKSLRDAGMSPELTMVTAARGRELPDGALRLESMNPVFVVWGQR